MKVREAVERRRSIKNFDPAHELDDDQMRELFEPLMFIPSSFNLQHWRYVAVREKAGKEALCEASYGQRQVGDCSVVVAVTAKLNAHEDAAHIWRESPPNVIERMVSIIEKYYGDDERLQRDEVMRSGSLGAMALMLLASAQGLDSCPMIGFNAKKVHELLDIPDTAVIVMLLCIGKATKPARPRIGRFSTQDVVRLEGFHGPGLPPSSVDAPR